MRLYKMSIALFIKELLSENKFSSDFSEKIEERIKVLNGAQLQGMYNHLIATTKTSKSLIWRSANMDLLHRIEGILEQKNAEDKLENKIIENIKLKKKQKIQKQQEEKMEQERVMVMIAENAKKTAEQEVRENEFKRQAADRLSVLGRIYKVEEKRNLYWKIIAVVYVVSVVIIAVFLADLLILIAALGGISLLALILAYCAHLLTIIRPSVVAPEDLENQIHQREDILMKQALMSLKEKERCFGEQQRKDREEAKKRRKIKKERQRFEAQLLAQRRQQELAMAEEIFERNAASSSSRSNSLIVIKEGMADVFHHMVRSKGSLDRIAINNCPSSDSPEAPFNSNRKIEYRPSSDPAYSDDDVHPHDTMGCTATGKAVVST
jgi:hypothetical protein